MGRTAKFTEDLLLDAVIQYSEVVKTKIKATELALWARNNIVGLDDVQDYHFTRPIKNPVTGKKEKRLCTIRIEELNVKRDTKQRENTNVLLSSVNIDQFYELDERSQRKTIQETRDIVSEYKSTNNYLRQQNAYWKSLVNTINENMELYASTIKEIKKKQSDLGKKVAFVSRSIEDAQLRKQLEKMGIADGDFDLVKYNESLKEDISELFNIERAIKQYQRNLNMDDKGEELEEPQPKTNLIDELTDF